MNNILPTPHPQFRQLQDNPASPFDFSVFWRRKDGLTVARTVTDLYGDGKTWLHVSVSHKDRLPTYSEMALVKKEFIGPDREAYQVFAQDKNHVNIHEFCLHLWSCLEGPVLPDFSFGGMTI